MPAAPVTFPERLGIGNPRYNPFARLALGLLALKLLAALALIGLAFSVHSAQARTTLVLTLFGLVMLGPIPLVLALIFSRRVELMLRMIHGGQSWAHWSYSDAERARAGGDLPGGTTAVYLGPIGIVWERRARQLVDFRSALKAVRLEPASLDRPARLVFNYIFLRRSRFGFVLWVDQKTTVVPVPPGRSAEAEALVPRYQALIGQPSEALNSEWRLAWAYGAAMLMLLPPILLALFPLSTQAIAEEFAVKATQSALNRAAEVDAARAAYHALAARLDSAYQAARTREAPGWQAAEPAALGFDSFDNVIAVYWGRCVYDDAFYFYTVERAKTIAYGGSDPAAFLRTTAADPILDGCTPPEFTFIVRAEALDEGWFYTVLLRDRSSLLTAIAPYYTPGPPR